MFLSLIILNMSNLKCFNKVPCRTEERCSVLCAQSINAAKELEKIGMQAGRQDYSAVCSFQDLESLKVCLKAVSSIVTGTFNVFSGNMSLLFSR